MEPEFSCQHLIIEFKLTLTAVVRGPPNRAPILAPFSSEICNKMRDELTGLLEIFYKVEEAGGKATLSITTFMGVTNTKLDIVSPTPSSTVSTSPSSPPAPGNQAAGRRRRRNRGAAARARRNQRAAASQATLAEVDPPPRLPPSPPPRPLRHLLSPSPTSGRRRVMSLGRPEMPTFSTLNLDGSSSPPPAPPPPSQSTPFICYDDCEEDLHCSKCGKCYALCHEHSGCDCSAEDGLEIDFHCALCCCGRSLEIDYCKLKSLLSPADYHTASHTYL